MATKKSAKGNTKTARKKSAGTAKKKAAAPRAKSKTTAKTGAAAKAAPRGGAKKTAASKRTAAKKKAPPRKAAPGLRVTRNMAPEEKEFIKKFGKKLSRSTQRAKWISSSEEHADRNGQSLATRNHDVIRQWAEERGAVPATIAGTEHEGRPGVLRFNFPGFGESDRLQEISWDEWFETFNQRNLVFVFQEKMKAGNQSNFFILDNPEREEG
jgi:hypothetical protein